MTIRLNEENFQTEVLESDQPILVDFWARWCAPCRMLAPILEQLEAERPDLRIGKVDIDMWPMLAMRYSVSAIPLLIWFKNGEPAGQTLGLVGKKEIEAMLDA